MAGASGSVTGSGGGNSVQVGAAGMGVVVGGGKLFVPEDITSSLVENSSALTLIAATMIDDGENESYWCRHSVAMRRFPCCSFL